MNKFQMKIWCNKKKQRKAKASKWKQEIYHQRRAGMGHNNNSCRTLRYFRIMNRFSLKLIRRVIVILQIKRRIMTYRQSNYLLRRILIWSQSKKIKNAASKRALKWNLIVPFAQINVSFTSFNFSTLAYICICSCA